MSTLFKHKAAKVRCRGSDQDINTIGMSRQQTNLSALDTEALSMERYLNRKTELPALKSGQDDSASTWSQKVPNGPLTKRISCDGATAGQHNPWLEGSELTLGNSIRLLTVQHPHPICWSSDSWWGKAINSPTGSNTMSPTLQQDNDISWTWQVKQRQATSCWITRPS